jgi:hypothetical protein
MAWSRSAIVLAGVMAAASSANAQTNLVQNGDFSSYTNSLGSTDGSEEVGPYGDNNPNDVTSWTSAGYNMLFVPGTATGAGAYVPEYNAYLSLWGAGNGGVSNWNGNGPPGVGGNFMALDGDYQTGAISQTITGLTQGTVYAVSFWYAFAQQTGFFGPTTQDLTVGLGSSKQSVPAFMLASQDFSGWMQDTVYIEADSTSEVLSFLASGNIQLPPFALLADVSMVDAPEPATWAMLGVGLAGLVGAARLRRGKGAIAALS